MTSALIFKRMEDTETLRLHPTNSGGESGPMIGKFSSKAVLIIGASLLIGLMAFILFEALQWSSLVSLLIASIIPLVTLGVLLALAGKPAGFARHWLEWQYLKFRDISLFNHEFLKENNNDC